MNAKHQRLWILSVSIACLAVSLAFILYALQENISYFYTPSHVKAKSLSPNQSVRLGGMVEKDSVQRDGLILKFTVSDFVERIQVQFTGIAPDLFREGQGVVAEGHLNEAGVFVATRLLAKHDENYMPPEIAQMQEHKK